MKEGIKYNANYLGGFGKPGMKKRVFSQKARDTHVCHFCELTINRGEVYYLYIFGYARNWKVCFECDKTRRD